MASPSVSRILYLSSPAVLDSTGDDHPSWRGVAAPLMRLPGTWPTGSRRPVYLAPGGVYQAVTIARHAGGLLHHHFTLACATDYARPSWCNQDGLISSGAIGGLLSAALSVGLPRLEVIQHPALWSPDFPQSFDCGHPTGSLNQFRAWQASFDQLANPQHLKLQSPEEPAGRCCLWGQGCLPTLQSP